jgi:hypothetical protein
MKLKYILVMFVLVGFSVKSWSYSRQLVLAVSSSLDISCKSADHNGPQLAFKMRSDYSLSDDPTSQIGYDNNIESYDVVMSLAGYTSAPRPRNTIWKFVNSDSKDFIVSELSEGANKNISIFAKVPEKEGYSVQLDLHATDFKGPEVVWAPEYSAFYFDGSSESGNFYLSGSLAVKKLKGDDTQVNRNYSWRGIVNCFIDWNNESELYDPY